MISSRSRHFGCRRYTCCSTSNWKLHGSELKPRFLIRDNAKKFTAAHDTVFRSDTSASFAPPFRLPRPMSTPNARRGRYARRFLPNRPRYHATDQPVPVQFSDGYLNPWSPKPNGAHRGLCQRCYSQIRLLAQLMSPVFRA